MRVSNETKLQNLAIKIILLAAHLFLLDSLTKKGYYEINKFHYLMQDYPQTPPELSVLRQVFHQNMVLSFLKKALHNAPPVFQIQHLRDSHSVFL